MNLRDWIRTNINLTQVNLNNFGAEIIELTLNQPIKIDFMRSTRLKMNNVLFLG